MARNFFEHSKRYLNIGIIGATGDGKSTLAAVLSSNMTDNTVSERGAIMNISQGECESEKSIYHLFDFDWHADYIKAMITGAVQLDGAILVVGAAAGPMPQTREQVLLASQCNVPEIIVFMNKTDQVDDPELLDLVEMLIRELLNKYGFRGDDTPIIRGSALDVLERGTGIKNDPVCKCIYDLMDACDNFIPDPFMVEPHTIHPHTKFKSEVYVLKKEEGSRHTPFFAGYKPQFYFRTTDVTGNITLPEGVEMVMPGDHATFEVELIEPAAIEEGMRFAVREGAHTVGVGIVTQILE